MEETKASLRPLTRGGSRIYTDEEKLGKSSIYLDKQQYKQQREGASERDLLGVEVPNSHRKPLLVETIRGEKEV